MRCPNQVALLLFLALACAPVVVPVEPDRSADSLVRVVEVGPDDTCPGGGTAILTGRDDGDEGGTAGDGVLSDGEVDSRNTICLPEREEPTPPESPFLPIEGTLSPAGPRLFHARGGDGVADDGGVGGRLVVQLFPGAQRGHVAVVGGEPTEVGLPDIGLPAALLGATPWEIEGEATLAVARDPEELPDGAVYLSLSTPATLVRKGQIGAVSGIHVKPGATLHIVANTPSAAEFNVSGPVLNEGTIVVDLNNGRRPDLRLGCESYIDRPDALLDLRAPDGTADGGGLPGGALILVADRSPPAVPVPRGTFVVLGTIDTRGGSGRFGGRGGQVTVTTRDAAHVRGSILTGGGAVLADGAAGSGGDLALSVQGPISIRGLLDTSSSDGGTSGAPAGDILLQGLGVLVDGDLRLDSGSLVTCPAACGAGEAGDLRIESGDAPIALAGTIHARGGSASVGTEGNGGRGGDVSLDTRPALTRRPQSFDRSVYLSADLELDGGDGAVDGARGGIVRITVDASGAVDSRVRLAGYGVIDLQGGAAGTDRGGEGGQLDLQHLASGGTGIVGGVVLAVPALLSGGEGGIAGAGGILRLESLGTGGGAWPERVVRLLAPVDLFGGTGRSFGGRGGHIVLRGDWGVDVDGALGTGGGDSQSGGGVGGVASRAVYQTEPILFEALLGTVALRQPLVARGGTAPLEGGAGGAAVARARRIELLAPIDLGGGDGTTGNGGDGGQLSLTTGPDGYLVDGPVIVDGGDGARLVGARGLVLVDGLDQTDALAE